VAVGEAKAGAIEDTWTFLGDVRALDRAELAAATAGPVVSVSVREGDRVTSGQTLLEVDTKLAAAQSASATASAEEGGLQLEQARRDLARLQRVAEGVLAPAELEQAKTRVDMLAARHAGLVAAADRARVELGRHRVRAPFDGLVAQRHVDAGDWVAPGQAVLDLVSTDRVDIRVDASAELAQQVAPGDAVVMHGRGEVAGVVVGVVPALDPVSRTALVRVEPSEAASWLVPGSSVEVAFDVQRGGEGVLVPRDALVPGPVETRVVRVVDGAAQPVTVLVLASTHDTALVSGEGLVAGDVVVVRGNERLRPGQGVRVAGE
jgi:RND family efflux transporter MFP subunit